MPIRKPIKTTIRSHDFRDHTFSFPVESVLKPQQESGKLIISASAGYLLTTSADPEPTAEQSLEHVLQPDGNRVARGTVTLLANDEAPENSTITIRDPSGETVILTVDTTPETALIALRPALLLSAQALSFAPTAPGKLTHLIFTITQQNADTPVTLTTDAPEQFQLASDSRPVFAPGLTFTPSATGTNVHVRFSPTRSGLAEARLSIETPYASQSILLMGQGSGWLPTRREKSVVSQPVPVTKTSQSSTRMLWLSQFLIVGLVLAGYQFRCQLMPSLCQELPVTSITGPNRPQPDTQPIAKVSPDQRKRTPDEPVKPADSRRPKQRSAKAVTTAVDSVATPVTRTRTPLPDKTEAPALTNAPLPPAGISTRTLPTRRVKPPADSQAVSPGRRQTAPTSVTPTTGESELEQELNKKPKNQ